MCFAARPWGVTRTENRGIGVVSYSETPELEFGGPNDNRKLISISAMPQYINRSHEELRSKDYELLKVKASSFPCQNKGNAFQQSSSPFGLHSLPVPSVRCFCGGGLLSSSPTSSVLGISNGGFRTSTFEFPNVPPSEGPSVSPFTALTTASFGTLPWSNSSSGGSFSFGTSNNPVSPTSGFSFYSSSSTGNSSIVGNQASSGSQSTTSTKHQGSRVPYYSATTEVEVACEIEYVCKLQSISAMPSYNEKSHEELRLEDYGFGDKGGQVLWGKSFHAPPSLFPFPQESSHFFVSPFQPFKSTFPEPFNTISTAPTISPFAKPFPFPPLSNQSSVAPFQLFKSTFSELERGNSVTSSNAVSTPLTISPFVKPSFTLQPDTASFGPTFTSNWKPSKIPRTEPMHPDVFQFPKTSPSSTIGTFSFTKPSVIFSPFIRSTPATPSDSWPSIVAPSQLQQTAEKVGSFPINDLNKSSQGFSFSMKPWNATGAECLRSIVASYSKTPEYEGPASAKLNSISAMPHYKDRSHEEMRLEDYELLKELQGKTVTKYQGSRVAPYSATTETEFDMTNSIGFIGNIHSISALPSYHDRSLEELRLEDYGIGDKGGATLWGSPFFRSYFLETSDTPNIFLFPPSSNQSSVLSPFQPFKSTFSDLERKNCTTPSITMPCTKPMHTSSEFPKISVFPDSSVETFSFPKPPSTSPVTSSHSCSSTVSKSQPQQAAERSGSLPTDNLHTPSQASSGHASVTEFTSQNDNEQYDPPRNMSMQTPLVANPFATRIPDDQPVTSRLHGISSLQVSDNSSLNRRESLLRIWHVSPRLPGLPTRRPNGGSSETKVPFFIDEDDKLGPVAPSLPREKSRARVNVSSSSLHSPEYSKDDEVKECYSSIQLNEDSTRLTDVTATQDEDKVSAPTERYVADVLALLPKLPAADYYIKPSLSELAAREMAEAGFCSHVRDFIVGREGYGSIKFLGETDIRHLDIESIVQFKDREVTVYTDDEKKPQVGQHLNKEAEVTLLNVKCIDSKTGEQYVEGHQVQSYQEMLIKKIEEEGAEFVSYDPVEGEWKVRVQHF